MDKITKEMIKIYQPLDYDWMNYKINRNSNLTYHHIIKDCNGGKRSIENGALLIEVAHQYLHLIECKDIDIYIGINKMFEMINKQKSSPTKEQRETIESMLLYFEYKHRNDKNSKGKNLIQYKYKKRF